MVEHAFGRIWLGRGHLSRVLNKPIVTIVDVQGSPCRFSWKTQWHQVADVLEEWSDTGCWWDNEGEKQFFRLRVQSGGIYELYFDLHMQKWFLYRVLD